MAASGDRAVTRGPDLISEGAGGVVVRLSPRQFFVQLWWPWLVLPGLVGVLVLFFRTSTRQGTEVPLGYRIGMVVVTAVVGVGYGVVSLWWSRIELTGEELVVRSLRDGAVHVRRAEVDRVIDVRRLHRAVGGRAAEPTFRMLLFVGDGRRLVVRIDGRVWSRDTIDRLAASGWPVVEVAEERISTEQFERREPGLLATVDAHPRKMFWITLAAILVVMSVIVVVAVMTA